MSTFKYFTNNERQHQYSACSQLLPVQHWRERSLEQRRLKVNARMTTADHDRQEQAAHRRYKLHTTVDVASDKGDEYSTLISAM